MSVVDILRRDAVAVRNNALIQNLRAHEAKTRALRSLTNLISKNAGLSELLNTRFDTENSPPPGSEESPWLKSNDLSNGRYFDDTSIPFPSLTQDGDSIFDSKLNRPSADLPGQVQENSNGHVATIDGLEAITADPTSSLDPTMAVAENVTTSAFPNTEEEPPVAETYSQEALLQPDGLAVVPDKVAPPEPDEEAQFSDATQRLLDLETPEKPTKVVHLPPEDVREKRSHDAEDGPRRKSDEVEQAKASKAHLQTQTELASSPSSTVGAYSAATPMPPQDSPDTSPDSESAEQIEVLPPKDLRPSPEEQREKEEHDRLLAAQKEIARRQALGDVSTADEQLKWEEREAAARDAEERTAREDVNGPEPGAGDALEETQAEEVAEEVKLDNELGQPETAPPTQGLKDDTQPSTVDEPMGPPAAQEEGDNITVAPRNKAPLTIDTSRTQQTSMDDNMLTTPALTTPAEQERMTTRISSGVLQQRTVSEILGQTPTSARRGVMSPEMISPTAFRHPHDISASGPSSNASQTPRRSRQSGLPRTPSNSQPALDDLAVLKGAAEDPDRDYLEPLFRIQAHDSPSVRTTSLNDLVRSASKTLSTEDHFTNSHERVDFRILRRIYQLQNANKWSLRQMHRAKEVEQPVTHHDHMMAEMQWMRKDFKSERKMKKNVCAWLAKRCAEWVAASAEERKRLQLQVRPPKQKEVETSEEHPPDLEHSGESAPEDDARPPTPTMELALRSSLIVPPELSETVHGLQKAGKLSKAIESLPITGFSEAISKAPTVRSLSPLSKFVEGKVLPKVQGPSRKRSRYDYDDDAELLEEEPDSKRLRQERDLAPEDQEIALFHPDNKHIRDRLHANNAFRPPSEFVMPSTQFYEFRNGSQWIWEDDQKLRKLAKEYSFNWSLIADELQLPVAFKSSAERRTPWECFERWVELEQLPTEMKKTMYFKTWYQRLEQSQQAAERRYQAQVAALQAQSNGQASHVPLRRRTIPTRVEKRKNTRYLWLVDAMRKLARKKEQAAFKAAESQRAAAQRKSQSDNTQPRQPMLTPQEFSKKRYEADLRFQEQQRQHRVKMLEAQQRQIMAARQAAAQQQQQGMQNGAPNQQRPVSNSSNMPPGAPQAQMQGNGQQQPNANGQVPPQQAGRPQQNPPMATRNGHLAVPQVNGQGIQSQAQMRMSNGQMPNPQDMQRFAQQARGGQQYPNGLPANGQQGYPQMQNAQGNMPSPGGMTAQQQMQNNQAMLANLQAQMNNATHPHQGSQQVGTGMSPSMPPPPTPAQNHPQAQQLSSGHVPAFLNIKAKIKAQYPHYTDDQITTVATEMLKSQSQSTNHARQSAMNAAAGINGGGVQQTNMSAYGHNQAAAFQNPNQMQNGNYGGNVGVNGDGATSPQQHYATLMRQRQLQQMRMQQHSQSPNGTHASLSVGSPSMAHASPVNGGMTPVSPNLQYNQMASVAGMSMGMQQQPRPPSRSSSATPQMPRVGSSGPGGMQSPGGLPQGSPRGMQAGMAR